MRPCAAPVAPRQAPRTCRKSPRFTSGDNRLTFVNGTFGLTGGVVIDSGTLTFAQPTDANLADASGGLAFGGGTLQVNGSFSSACNVTLNAGGTFEVDFGQSLLMTGDVAGTGGLIKSGDGIFLLLTRTATLQAA